jgi:hypothetical protein
MSNTEHRISNDEVGEMAGGPTEFNDLMISV